MKYALVVLALAFSLSAVAHSGRTDANGCHYDRSAGTYHCH
ncbi:YHYH domain-containing protein [Methylotenera sp. G11]|nr:YHYH domain-containing protein [Methylotenera sp. G11]